MVQFLRSAGPTFLLIIEAGRTSVVLLGRIATRARTSLCVRGPRFATGVFSQELMWKRRRAFASRVEAMSNEQTSTGDRLTHSMTPEAPRVIPRAYADQQWS